MSDNVLSADNQQERPKCKVNPWYIVGFVEGEGTFHIALYKDPNMKTGVKIIPEFHVNQSYLRISTLKEIQKYFGCGYIKVNHAKRENDDTYVLVVRDRDDLLKIIIPFFKRYPLRSIKNDSYLIFSRIVEMMNSGKHRSKDGVKKIIKLAYQMNANGKYRAKRKEEIMKYLESSETTC